MSVPDPPGVTAASAAPPPPCNGGGGVGRAEGAEPPGKRPGETPALRACSRALEPEVLPSLEEAERSSGGRDPFRPQGMGRPMGCTAGPGCGCAGLPLALVAGGLLTAFMALLWLLSLGRVPVSIVRMAQRMRRGTGRG